MGVSAVTTTVYTFATRPAWRIERGEREDAQKDG